MLTTLKIKLKELMDIFSRFVAISFLFISYQYACCKSGMSYVQQKVVNNFNKIYEEDIAMEMVSHQVDQNLCLVEVMWELKICHQV